MKTARTLVLNEIHRYIHEKLARPTQVANETLLRKAISFVMLQPQNVLLTQESYVLACVAYAKRYHRIPTTPSCLQLVLAQET